MENIKEENFESYEVSDFCSELKSGSKEFAVRYVSPCLVLEKSGKKVCEWFFNEKTTKKGTHEIIKDFSNIILDKKSADVNIKNEDATLTDKTQDCVNFDKMLHKVLQFFPNLRESYDTEFNDNSSMCKKINFIKEFVVPDILKMISRTRDDNRLERLFSNLCDDYVFGDETCRCVVTMLFFNSITEPDARKKVKEYIPKYMLKAWNASWRMRNF